MTFECKNGAGRYRCKKRQLRKIEANFNPYFMFAFIIHALLTKLKRALQLHPPCQSKHLKSLFYYFYFLTFVGKMPTRTGFFLHHFKAKNHRYAFSSAC